MSTSTPPPIDPVVQQTYDQANALQIRFGAVLDEFHTLRPASVALAGLALLALAGKGDPAVLEPEALAWLLNEACGTAKANDVPLRSALHGAYPIFFLMRDKEGSH